MPDAIIIGGANGAGKTTFARQYLATGHPKAVYLNADEISREHPSFAQPVAAGREYLRRLAAHVSAGEDFALETTLASRMYSRRIPEWKATGYRITLYFIEVPSAEFSIQRVASRVAAGGHHVPEVDIRRRHQRGLNLFKECYRHLADEWYHYSTDEEGTYLVESSQTT
ncbi:MAG: zeta toxin family protein [Planctomycetota bacterium]